MDKKIKNMKPIFNKIVKKNFEKVSMGTENFDKIRKYYKHNIYLLCFFPSCAILLKLKQGGRKMSLKKNEMLSEYIEYMLRIGMKVGEIEAVISKCEWSRYS